jgi:multimeric flavodoxin WrbA
MKIMTILGSPRAKGNTSKILNWIEDELRAGGHKVSRVGVGDGKIRGCVECFGCKRVKDKPGCSVRDGGNALFEQMLKSDLILFASPLFCWGVTAQIKAVFDRAYCLLKFNGNGYNSLLKGKRLALLVTGGSEVKGNIDLAVPPFREFASFFKCRNAGSLLVPYCREPKNLNPAIEKKARAFARSLLKTSR